MWVPGQMHSFFICTVTFKMNKYGLNLKNFYFQRTIQVQCPAFGIQPNKHDHRCLSMKTTKTGRQARFRSPYNYTGSRNFKSHILNDRFWADDIYLTNYDVPCKGHLKLWSTFMKLEPFLVKSGILQTSVYNVYGSQNEFVECVTRIFILRMRSLGQNGPLRQITVFAVVRISLLDQTFLKHLSLTLCLPSTNPLCATLFWGTPELRRHLEILCSTRCTCIFLPVNCMENSQRAN